MEDQVYYSDAQHEDDTAYAVDSSAAAQKSAPAAGGNRFGDNFFTWKIAVIVCCVISLAISLLYIAGAVLSFILVLAIPPHFVVDAITQLSATVFQLFPIVAAAFGLTAAFTRNELAADMVCILCSFPHQLMSVGCVCVCDD